ncbi:hypothetical protein PU629_06465 [Pullulanibacillus sp. KACC 23026]|uniref:phage tail protein n=1 Tax=Pullulanibacillus sp. KACC 23026 TaxID=3028315 RepID=UPI0023AE9A7B|nr:hypothetical protein [Pullulanibacillus sp. KACC 23026]WEG14008.1 hypothetical protein PU629_06465 [Pullulanibacillus sp. KACC 23026]
MAGVVRNLMVRAGADFSPLESAMRRSSSEMNNFGSRIESALSGIKSKFIALGAAYLGIDGIKEATQDAIELEATTENLDHILGSSAQSYENWSQTVATSYGFSQLQAEKYGASFAHMISLFTNGTQQITQRTEDLMKTAAIIANGTGRSIDDVMERIQSGMLGNVEAINDLGVYANQSMLEMSQGFKAIANGRTWDQLTMAERQQVIYMSIMEQATKQYGDTLQNNVHNKLVTFTATLNNLKVGIGNAFLPILNVALPVLTALAQRLVTAMSYVDQFMQALFGTHQSTAKASDTATASTNKQAVAVNNLGNAVTNLGKAKQKASRGVAGFDQVHTLDVSTSTGTGGSTGGTGSAGGADAGVTDQQAQQTQGVFGKISDSIKNFADKVKTWLKPLKPYWDDIVTSVENLGKAIADLWNSPNFQKFLGWLAQAIRPVIINFLKRIADGINILTDAIKIITDIINGNWHKAWEDTLDLLNNFVGFVTGIKADEWGKIFQNAWGDIKTWFKNNVSDPVGNFINNTKTNVKNLGNNIWSGITNGWGDITGWFKKNVVSPISNSFNSLRSIGSDIWHWLTSGLSNSYSWYKNNIVTPLGTAFNSGKSSIEDKASNVWSGIKKKFANSYSWWKNNVVQSLHDVLDNSKDSIAGRAGDIWSSIKKKFSNSYSWYKNNVAQPLGTSLSNWKNSIASKAGDIWSAIKGKFGGAYSWFKNNVANPIGSALGKISSGLKGGIESGFKAIFDKAADFLNRIINAFNKVKSKIPFGLGNAIPNVPTIPHLAKGGITNGPMLAMIGDNPGGQEVVSPLDKLQGMIVSAVSTAMQFNNSQGSNAGGDIKMTIDGKTFARIIKPYLDQEAKRVGTNIRLKSV